MVFPFASLHPNAGALLRREILLLPESLCNHPVSSHEGEKHCNDLIPSDSVIPVTTDMLQVQQRAGENLTENDEDPEPNGAGFENHGSRTRTEANRPWIAHTSDSSSSESASRSPANLRRSAPHHSPSAMSSRGPSSPPTARHRAGPGTRPDAQLRGSSPAASSDRDSSKLERATRRAHSSTRDQARDGATCQEGTDAAATGPGSSAAPPGSSAASGPGAPGPGSSVPEPATTSAATTAPITRSKTVKPNPKSTEMVRSCMAYLVLLKSLKLWK
jgi:hypothetical protein